MSNVHEYVVFDRAKLDPALAMTWPAFEKSYPGWCQWESARDFLIEWVLSEAQIEHVDDILRRKTVRATLRSSDNTFHVLHAILGEKGLVECAIEVGKEDYDYGDEIVSCAGAGYVRGDLSLPSLTAVYRLHASRVDPTEVLPRDVATAVLEQPGGTPMLPGLPDMNDFAIDCIGISQSKRVIDFLLKAWRERWPLNAEAQTTRNVGTIRSCEVADCLVRALRKCHLVRPCMFRWYEC